LLSRHQKDRLIINVFAAPLIAARLNLLRTSGMVKQHAAASAAWEVLSEEKRQASRSLVVQLILDKEAWPLLYREWQKLVDANATLEDLVRLDSADMETRFINPPFGLTAGGACAVARVVERCKPLLLATPFMKAIHAFPRALYHGHPVPAELADFFTLV
jgi:hypothetical protein